MDMSVTVLVYLWGLQVYILIDVPGGHLHWNTRRSWREDVSPSHPISWLLRNVMDVLGLMMDRSGGLVDVARRVKAGVPGGYRGGVLFFRSGVGEREGGDCIVAHVAV